MDFDDHDGQLAGSISAEEEAGWIEDVPEASKVGHERDPPPVGVETVGPEDVRDRLLNGSGRRHEVVGVVERQQASPVAPDQAEPPRDLVELIQIERGVEDAVLESVVERPHASMPDDSLEQMRSHAARSTRDASIRLATSHPDRQPSS